MKEDKSEDNPIYRFKKVYHACGLSFYALHTSYKQSVRACSAKHSKDKKEKNVVCIQRRPEHKVEGEEEQHGKEILVKGNEQT